VAEGVEAFDDAIASQGTRHGAMVHGHNKKDAGIGGHISTYSSLATLLKVGFNHFFHASYQEQTRTSSTFKGMPPLESTHARI
jgi:pyruvate dehydrogenase complex dehydrogenase (E1) component